MRDGGRPVALVTGSAHRLGRAIALGLAEAGYDLALHHRDSGDAARDVANLARDGGVAAKTFTAELSAAKSVLALARDVVDWYGRVDLLVNNASAFFPSPLDATSAADVGRAADVFHAVHVRAPLLLIHALAPGMRERGSGAVVNITDLAVNRPKPGYAPYTASKAALVSLTQSLARELAPTIRVNAVAPGAILPPKDAGPDEEKRLAARVPMGRLGTPEEVAATVLFLATGPTYVTGQVVAVAGGN